MSSPDDSMSAEADDAGACRRWGTERLAVALCLLAAVVLPLVFKEAYPYTIAPMYSFPLSEYAVYRVETLDGRVIHPGRLALQSSYYGSNSLHLAMGRTYPSINVLGKPVPERAALIAHVREQLRQPGMPTAVRVRERIYGAVDGQRAGVARETWIRIDAEPPR